MGAVDDQLAYLRELRDGITAQLDAAGLGFVNEWASEQLEGADDVSVARPVGGLPEQLTETVQKSYAEVCALLDGLDPKGPGSWEAKVCDSKRCGLVKAVCAADGSFEWVEARWKAHYEQRGGAARLEGGGIPQSPPWYPPRTSHLSRKDPGPCRQRDPCPYQEPLHAASTSSGTERGPQRHPLSPQCGPHALSRLCAQGGTAAYGRVTVLGTLPVAIQPEGSTQQVWYVVMCSRWALLITSPLPCGRREAQSIAVIALSSWCIARILHM